MFFDVHVLVRTPAYMPFAPLACNSTNNTPIPSAAVQLVSRRLPAHSLDSDETPHRTCPSPAPSLPRLAHPNPPEPALNRTPSLTLLIDLTPNLMFLINKGAVLGVPV